MSRVSSLEARNDGASEFAYMAIAEATSPQFTATPSTPHYEIFANFAPPNASSMKYRNLGKSGLKVPMIGFSAWSAFGTRLSEQAADELISVAYDNGINFFDTGDGFVNGRCEALLGNILKKRGWKRSSFIVATKLFWNSGPTASASAPALSRKFIIEAVEASLKRLQLKYIDIVLINKLDGMCPMEEIVRAMGYIMDKGLACYWGTSRWSPVHIMEAFNVARQFNCPPPTIEQMEYHMFTREKMELYMPEMYHKLGVGVISWSPYSLNNDEGIQLISRRSANVEEANKSTRTAKQLELNPVTVRLGCDNTQFAIGWSLRNENCNCVLIAPRTVDQLYLQLNTLKLVPKLTLPIMEEIEKILDNKPALRRIPQSNSATSPQAPIEETDEIVNATAAV